jgi:formylglycine-generating enzyme required for sulfatase activity
MPYNPTWKERLEEAKPYLGPALAGVIVLSLGGWLAWHTWGAKSGKPLTTPPKDVLVRDAAAERVAAEVEVLETKYRLALEAGVPETTAQGILDRVIEKQRELMRLLPQPTSEQTDRLARLEAARGSQRSRSSAAQSQALEKEAEVARQAGQTGLAMEKMREALRLQHEANKGESNAGLKDMPRESQLAREIDAAEAEPLARSVGTALTLARSAAVQERWESALKSFAEARKTQAELNKKYPTTRYADVAALDTIDSEIESIHAAGLAATVASREREGDLLAKTGRAKDAASSYSVAAATQREINQKFPRSRFASAPRVEEIEVQRQTALSGVLLTRAAEIDREVARALRRRQTTAVAEPLAEATRMVEQAEVEFPRSRALDPVLKLKLAYLALRARELGPLQDQLYDRLAPLPGSGNFQLLKTEVPQELYQRVMNTNPSRNIGRGLPVDSVSWLDAQEFCGRLSWILGLRVRLPTEAEFRAAWAANEGAWSADNSDGRSRETGKSPATAPGFYDLAGNLGEWLEPAGVSKEAPVAGGSYLDPAEALKTLKIATEEKRERARHIGFRVLVERVAEL